MQVLQHAWTYKPLVQDVLGMSLNRVTLDAEPAPGQQLLQPGAAPSKKTYEVGEGDFFWDANGRNQFPKVAEDADAQLKKYKQVRPWRSGSVAWERARHSLPFLPAYRRWRISTGRRAQTWTPTPT